jgi:DivIVA domain-containing protein
MTNDLQTPEFTTAIRGYDKLQVDEYVERLQDVTEEAEERARHAESELEVTRHTTVGPRVGEIMELAVTEAKEMQVRARTQSEDVLSDARESAEDILAHAREREKQLQVKIERDKDDAALEIEGMRRRAHVELEQLEETRAAILADLHRLHDALGAAAGIISPDKDQKSKVRPQLEPAPDPEATKEHRAVELEEEPEERVRAAS